MSVPVPGLKVTIDGVDPDGEREQMDTSEPVSETDGIYCSCQSEYCDCGSKLGVTEASANKIYKHLGFSDGRKALTAEGYRETALHIWGTHNLSTEEVLSWVAEYNPTNIEWINDASCNIVFGNANAVLRVIVDSAEPFDRRVALAAAAALASFIESKETEADVQSLGTEPSSYRAGNYETEPSTTMSENRSMHVSTEALDSIEEFSQYLPPTGRWYKALSVPSKAISLFLRFAHKNDVKLPGAERRSLYYRRYGNPNYGGMTGILTRSYRRRLKLTRTKAGADPDGNVRHVRVLPIDFAETIADAYDYPDLLDTEVHSRNKSVVKSMQMGFVKSSEVVEPAPQRPLIVYDNLYEVNERKTVGNRSDARHKGMANGIKVNPGQRREAVDFPTPGAKRHPRKWPRRDRGPPPNRWLTDDYVFSPPHTENINVVDLREPWAVETSPLHEPFVFSGKKGGSRRHLAPSTHHHHHHQDEDDYDDQLLEIPPGGTTITLMPETEPPIRPDVEDENAYRTRRLLASMSMVADMEEHTTKQRSLIGRVGFPHGRGGSAGAGGPSSHRTSNHEHRRRTRDVWQRLG